MLLYNQRLVSADPQKQQEYDKGVKYLKDHYGKELKLIRVGFPKTVRGLDSRGDEVPNMKEPTPPVRIPYSARVVTDKGTVELWEYCDGMPELLPNQLYKATGKRGKFVEEHLIINIDAQPDLAFFMYYKSPTLGGGVLKVDDPGAEAREEGDKARAELDLQLAIYGTLDDVALLNEVATGWGVVNAAKKHPDTVRKELKNLVVYGEERKRRDPLSRGVAEFKEDLKITDALRLRIFITKAQEAEILTYKTGRYLIGERIVMQVPPQEEHHKLDYFCNYLSRAESKSKLQDLLRDMVNQELLDSIKDPKTFAWIAKVMELKTAFKKADEIRELVYAHFVPAPVDK